MHARGIMIQQKARGRLPTFLPRGETGVPTLCCDTDKSKKAELLDIRVWDMVDECMEPIRF